MKTCFALAAMAVMGLASAAYAGDATAPKAMSDSDLDKVTAGISQFQNMFNHNGDQFHAVGGNFTSPGIDHRSASNGDVHSDHRGAGFIPTPP